MKKKCKPTSTNAILWVLHSSVTTTFIQLKLNSCFSEGELLIQYFVYIFVWLTAIADHLLNTGCKLKAHKIFWRYQGSPRLFNISHQYFQFFNSPVILRSQSTHQADDNVSWYFFSKLIPLKIYGLPQIKKNYYVKYENALKQHREFQRTNILGLYCFEDHIKYRMAQCV